MVRADEASKGPVLSALESGAMSDENLRESGGFPQLTRDGLASSGVPGYI